MFLKVLSPRHEYILKVYIKSQQNFNNKSQNKQFSIYSWHSSPSSAPPPLAHDTSMHIVEKDSHFANALKVFILWNGVNMEIMTF